MDVHGVKSVHKLQSKDSSEPSTCTYLAPPEGLKPYVFTYHPDSQISSMAEDYSEQDFRTLALLYTATERASSRVPQAPGARQDTPFWRLLLDLAMPFMLAYFLLL